MRVVRFAACLLALPGGCNSALQGRAFGEPKPFASLDYPTLKESSGIAPSRKQKGAYFTHNDSSGGPTLYRFAEDGETTDIIVRGALNIDWEDLASVSLDKKPYLFIGDIGDNGGVRKSIAVFRVPEPTGDNVRVDQTYTLTYPDEPRNAETLLVHPKTGDITIVTKRGVGPAMVYYLPRPRKSGNYKLRRVGDIDTGETSRFGRQITGGAWSPDGRFVVLRTYLAAYEFAAGVGPNGWLKSKPQRITLGLEMQGEAITYSLDGKSLLTTSEGSPCPVTRIPIK